MTQEAQETQKNEEEVESHEEQKLAFPNASVVRVMREVLDKDKIISKRVKIEMNNWLAKMCREIGKELNKSPYSKIAGDDFFNAIKKYKELESIAEQKAKVNRALQRIVEDCQILINELEK